MMSMHKSLICLMLGLLSSQVSADNKTLDLSVYDNPKGFSTRSIAKPIIQAIQSNDSALVCHFDPNTFPTVVGLVDVIERSLCNNPQSKQAWALIKKQVAEVGVAKSSYLPMINASYNFGDGKTNYQVKDYQNLSYDTDIKSRNLSLEASWILFDFGMRQSKIDQEKFLLSAAYANQNFVLQSILFNATQKYYEVVRLQSVLTAELEAENIAQQNAIAAQERHEVGVGILADLLQAQTNQAKAISERIKAEGELQGAKGELASLMGAPVNTSYQIEKSENYESFDRFSSSIDELLALAKKYHPELIAAQAQIDASQAALKSVKREGFPVVSLTSSMTDSQQQGTPPAETKNSNFYWGIKLSIPLFDGFSRQNRIKSAEANLESKYAELEQTQQQIAVNVWKSYYGLDAATENMKAIDILQKSATQSYQVALGRYKAGVGSMLELLSAQNALVDAKQRKTSALSSWKIARIQLLASLGQLGLKEWSSENSK
ncbi:TolC family protein [Acinetobacter pittii]|uniref:TolC family protein n=1 Tax=Acinetobacter pittii TaxID=48296 RepID=UPI001EFDF763|nr:TolC family protein [Acinetobacter pittii]MCG9494224.1 TolC family protein [Acinetobacter pittii]